MNTGLGSEWLNNLHAQRLWLQSEVSYTLFQEEQNVWFYNPRREKGKTPKLQLGRSFCCNKNV